MIYFENSTVLVVEARVNLPSLIGMIFTLFSEQYLPFCPQEAINTSAEHAFIFKSRKYPGKAVFINVIGTWQSRIAVPKALQPFYNGLLKRILKWSSKF